MYQFNSILVLIKTMYKKNEYEHNKAINLTPRAAFSFGVATPLYTKASLHTQRKLLRRYERGSKINRTSHVLHLRHVVAGLSALKLVGFLYLTSFVPGAK